MRQDPNAVPHPRASCEQISHQQDQDEQPPAWPPKAWQPPARRSPAWQPPDQQPSYQPTSYRQAPPIYPAAQRPGFSGHAREDSGYAREDSGYAREDSGYAREDSGYAREDSGYDGYGAYDAAASGPDVGFAADRSEPRRFQSPWRQDAQPAHVNGWQGMPEPRPGDQETEATLARIRAAHRKTKRMQVVCVLLGACTAAIFLTAAISHQLDGHVELLTPVLLLTSSANFRRYAQRAAKYRAAEADILARAR
jgi:hypothetical protein